MEAVLVRKEEAAPGVMRLVFQPKEGKFSFRAGQHIMLKLHSPGVSGRYYSLASRPGQSEFELLVGRSEDEAINHWFWQKLRPGTTVEMEGPFGDFCLPEREEPAYVFIGAGTGIAPLRAMVLDLLENRQFRGPVVFLAGFRNQQYALLAEDFERLAHRHPGFTFRLALSETGRQPGSRYRPYVHDYYPDLLKGMEPALVYLCGPGAMVEEARLRLRELGFPENRILREMY